MYHYNFRFSPARQKSGLIFTEHKMFIEEAIKAVNGGISFKRDGKILDLLNIDDKEMVIKLTSQDPLANPARSLSALTRYLASKYSNLFEQYIYNKTLFNIQALSQESTTSSKDDFSLSNEEIMKALIELLYTYPNTKEVKVAKAQITEILRPFVEKNASSIFSKE
jgi:hypothetical protein